MVELSDNYSFVRLFEQKLCEYTGFSEAVAVDCCTHAIQLSLEALAIEGLACLDRDVVDVPVRTYMSVPMTLANVGWSVKLSRRDWTSSYPVLVSGRPLVFDAAVGFDVGMASSYPDGSFICLSFQQKKRLPLGRGGAIMLKGSQAAARSKLLHKLSYDGRDIPLGDAEQIASKPETVLRGWHFYMEPDKAARGILLLNQPSQLQPFRTIGSENYPSLESLPCLKQMW